MTITLTEAQRTAIENLRENWTRIGEPQVMIGGDGAVVVQCFYSTGESMWIAVEPDGYTHS